MASPIFKFPEIMKSLYERGKKEFPIETLIKEIKITTGFYKQVTVTEIIAVMEELEFIKKTENGFMIISFDGRKKLPEVEKKLEKQAKKEAKEYEDAVLSD